MESSQRQTVGCRGSRSARQCGPRGLGV